MKVHFQKILIHFLSGLLVVSFSLVPASASGVSSQYERTGFYGQFRGGGAGWRDDDDYARWLASKVPDGLVPGDLTDDEWRTLFEAQVGDLPAKIINADGSFSWKIVPDVYKGLSMSGSLESKIVFSSSSESAYMRMPNFTGYASVAISLKSSFLAPIEGTYSISFMTVRSLFLMEKGGHNYGNYSCLLFSGPKVFCEGENIVGGDSRGEGLGWITFFNDNLGSSYWEGYFLLTCVPTAYSGGDTYNITTRPTSISGNYGIIGDNGQITKVENNSSIVNETNNTYYNPVTGKSSSITDWSYNYADRSYTVTTDTGDSVSVTYGDETITIKEGDTTYNVYYLAPSSGGDVPPPSPSPSSNPCIHNWQKTDLTEPTCTRAGKQSYSCSFCGSTKDETLPALGHLWEEKQVVNTSYDGNGNLVQAGYIIYECSRCKEQYKDTSGTGPPGDSGIDIDGSIFDILGRLFESVSDFFLQVIKKIPEMFGGFADFLSAVFPFLPDEIGTILIFGVLSMVVVAILRLLLGIGR